MATAHLSNQAVKVQPVDNSLRNSTSQEEMAKQIQEAVILAESTIKKLEKQEVAFDRTQNLVYLGFIVLLVMVAGMVVTYIQMQIQSSNDINTKSMDSLSKINEKMDSLSNRIDTIDNRAQQTSPTATNSTHTP